MPDFGHHRAVSVHFQLVIFWTWLGVRMVGTLCCRLFAGAVSSASLALCIGFVRWLLWCFKCRLWCSGILNAHCCKIEEFKYSGLSQQVFLGVLIKGFCGVLDVFSVVRPCNPLQCSSYCVCHVSWCECSCVILMTAAILWSWGNTIGESLCLSWISIHLIVADSWFTFYQTFSMASLMIWL